MVFFAEISSLDFPKNVVYTTYLKLLTILIECLPAIFSQCLSLIKHKYTQFLKLLSTTIAKVSSVAKFWDVLSLFNLIQLNLLNQPPL